MKLDFFNYDIGLLPILNWLSSKVKLDFFQFKIGFLIEFLIEFLPKPYSMVYTWIHGIDLDS